MSKIKILMINLLVCLITGGCIGLVWYLSDGAKPAPKIVHSKVVCENYGVVEIYKLFIEQLEKLSALCGEGKPKEEGNKNE